MKGATALPWVSTIRPPNTTIINSTGSNQYFLRTRKNRQNSSKNAIGAPPQPVLELVAHRLARRPGRLAHDPVTTGSRLAPQAQYVLAQQAHQHGQRRHHDEEDEAEHHRAHDPAQKISELCPQPVQGAKDARPRQRRDEEHDRDAEPDRPAAARVPPAVTREQREEAG